MYLQFFFLSIELFSKQLPSTIPIYVYLKNINLYYGKNSFLVKSYWKLKNKKKLHTDKKIQMKKYSVFNLISALNMCICHIFFTKKKRAKCKLEKNKKRKKSNWNKN